MKDPFSTEKAGYLRKKINEYLDNAKQWYLQTPERALEQAYKATLMIKAIEDEHFGGNRISDDSANHSDSVMSYLQADLEKNLRITKLRLAEFKLSRSVLDLSNSALLEKLRSIDEVIAKYSYKNTSSSALVPVSQATTTDLTRANGQSYPSTVDITSVETVSEQTRILPNLGQQLMNRIKSEAGNSKAEEAVIKKFRSSRAKTRTVIRFLLVLILIPLLTQQLSKHFLVGPIVDHMRSERATIDESHIFLNSEMKEEALQELQSFEEELRFDTLINIAPQLSPVEIEEQVKEKATEIAEAFRSKSGGSIANVVSDLLAVVAFVVVIVMSKREIVVLKSFMDDIFQGLSDSVKAFIFILFTDLFVGFHSPHGWEVILEGLAGHLGVAANTSAIFLFIATIPVILDTIFKYWVFQYMSRISPSALATLRNMNE